jgi:hypothetical protein
MISWLSLFSLLVPKPIQFPRRLPLETIWKIRIGLIWVVASDQNRAKMSHLALFRA